MRRLMATLVIPMSVAGLLAVGCQSNGDDGSDRNGTWSNNYPQHSDTSAQTGSGTSTGTSGVSSGAVSPSR